MAAPAKRIDGIDFWRGFALLTIFIDHVPENIFQHVTQQNFGFSDAAELFVFLSGVSVALAYGTRFFDGETVVAVSRRLPLGVHRSSRRSLMSVHRPPLFRRAP